MVKYMNLTETLKYTGITPIFKQENDTDMTRRITVISVLVIVLPSICTIFQKAFCAQIGKFMPSPKGELGKKA